MCRPSCCNDSASSGTGIAIVALAALAAVVYVVDAVWPTLVEIARITVQVIEITLLVAGIGLGAAAVAWVVSLVIRLRRQHRKAKSCPACAGTGEVLWADERAGVFQVATCHECPAGLVKAGGGHA